jgi:hypothetical protein
MMPRAMDRKAGLGTRRMEPREARTVRAEKATAFPAVPMVSATAATTASGSPSSARWWARAARKRTTRKSA